VSFDGGYGPRRFRVYEFSIEAFPPELADTRQVRYLRVYLADLGAQAIVEEPVYFDRDFLSEFSAFYATSARGYQNACRRYHVFSLGTDELRAKLSEALAGELLAHTALQEAYLGFVVRRPVQATPLGRTVLRWYPERGSEPHRVTEPCRNYVVHLAGLPLQVKGLAWQQQDSAVGACATVALWTMLHSSALDERLAIPTTTDITRSAHQRWPLAHREFPAADGLHLFQLSEAIRSQGLRPALLEGDVPIVPQVSGFTSTRFAASCAALLRSGYPVLISARMIHGDSLGPGHAVCAVGFRPSLPPLVASGEAVEEDSQIACLYINDDNLGPAVRFELCNIPIKNGSVVGLVPKRPPSTRAHPGLANPLSDYAVLVPVAILAAVPDEIRMTTDYLNLKATRIAGEVSRLLHVISGGEMAGTTFSARFFRLKDYLDQELPRRLTGRRLLKARLGLTEMVRPMSLHVGVVRVGIGDTAYFDVLYDTTDSEPATEPFATLVYQQIPRAWLDAPGVRINAF